MKLNLVILKLLLLTSIVTFFNYNKVQKIKKEKITVKTIDGWKIVSTLYYSFKKSKPLYIVLHGLHSTRSVYPVQKKMLKKFNVLSIDLRGHGDSIYYRNKIAHWEKGVGNIFFGAFLDIEATVKSLEQSYINTNHIFIQGSSFSSIIALDYFRKNNSVVKGVILMSPGNAYGKSILKSLNKNFSLFRNKPLLYRLGLKLFIQFFDNRALL